eukprot:g5007.t1 g5007   contig18:426309-427129(-)
MIYQYILINCILLLAFATRFVASQQQPNKPKPLQPLGDVLLLVLDKDKNQKVTMEEIDTQLNMLEQLFQNAEGEEGNEYKQLLKGFKALAPKMFELLDSDGNKSLNKAELNVEELFEGIKSDEVISKLTSKFHALFPLRPSSSELESFVKTTLESIGGDSLNKENVMAGIEWLDDDEDGFISRKEVGKYYNSAGKKFLDISKTIKQMGPMLALFGGMDMNAGGGGGRAGSSGGFKMDL